MSNSCINCSSITLPLHSVETEDSRYCLECDPDYYCTPCYKQYLEALKDYRANPANWYSCVFCHKTDQTVKERQDPEEGPSGVYKDICSSCYKGIVDNFCRD